MTPVADYLNKSKINFAALTDVLVKYLLLAEAEIEEIDLMGDPIAYVNAKDDWNRVLDFGKLVIDEEIIRKNHWL